MLLERYLQILSIAIAAVITNKFRSVLTALGIIFGVAAVIAMMAIGNGARLEILDQIKLVGVNNIVILPLKQDDGNKNAEEEGKSLRKLLCLKCFLFVSPQLEAMELLLKVE